MARLFITAFLVTFVSIFIAQYSVGKIQENVFSGITSSYFTSITSSTFDLLDESIADRTNEDLKAVLLSLDDRFGTRLSLANKLDLNLPAKAFSILDSGGIFTTYDKNHNTTVHRASKQTDGIWTLELGISIRDNSIATATGPLSLIKDKLSGKDSETQSQVLAQLQKSYGLPISLQTRETLDLTDQESTQLDEQKIVVRNPDEDGELFWIELDEGGAILQAGPIDSPVAIRYLLAILILSFCAVLFVGCLLWLWPLWRDLQRLRKAAFAIGSGHLETRVLTRKTSLIHSVLDGFNQMAVRTENMVASQRELTSAVSHELRTPLARMMFDLEMAKQTENSDDRKRHLDSLELNVGELNTLVDELLTYARQERTESPLELEELTVTDMRAWLGDLVARAQRSRNSVCSINISTNITSKESLIFSPLLMGHAVSNALQNAMRFAEMNIDVHLEREQQNWVLSIEDDGPGIPLAEQERMFEPFSRLDKSRQRGSGNFGLGLSIVRKIANWHHGDACIATCRALNGTRVEIRWPISAQI